MGETHLSSSQKVGNNGTKYDATHKADLTDCEDIDCNGKVGGNSGELCNHGYETNCSDGFDNDALQLKDCELNPVAGSTTIVTPAYAEYDCKSYCQQNVQSSEVGSTCMDNIDNDWDAVEITGYYTNNYNQNQTGGIDCRWGGYFGYGTNYNPDEDCNQTILSNGKQCQLNTETNCTDGFDNDFDHDAVGMPNSGWSANTTAYLDYYGIVYSTDADFDDYDCANIQGAISNEAVDASFCFDNIDNDLDAYYWTGVWTANASTGIDCSDPDCLGVVNP